jgi:hypothetical protein
VLVEGEPVLRIGTARLFVEPDGALAPASAPILDAIARAGAASETAMVVVTMSGGSSDRDAEDGVARLARLAAALGQRGLGADRLSVAAPSVAATGDLARVLAPHPRRRSWSCAYEPRAANGSPAVNEEMAPPRGSPPRRGFSGQAVGAPGAGAGWRVLSAGHRAPPVNPQPTR